VKRRKGKRFQEIWRQGDKKHNDKKEKLKDQKKKTVKIWPYLKGTPGGNQENPEDIPAKKNHPTRE